MRAINLCKLCDMRHDFQLAWKPLIITDIVYKVVAFAILTPVVSLLLRGALAVSGATVLTDQDILIFLTGPVGWIAFIIILSVIIAILALEQAALMAVVAGAVQGRRISVRKALSNSFPLACPILKIALRLLSIGLLTAAPFLLAIGGVYFTMLRQYDINYYLTAKPPEFWVAAGIAGIITIALIAVLLRVLLPYVYALPLLLFEGVGPGAAIRQSRKRAIGNMRTISSWIISWYCIMFIISVIVNSIPALLANLILPGSSSPLWLVLITVGILLILWTIINLGLAIVWVTTFSVMLVNLYRSITGDNKPVLKFKVRPSANESLLFRFSRSHLVVTFAIVLIISLTVGVLSLNSVQTYDDTEITAHRGASAAAPENSMAAIEQAIDEKADWVEIDVQESKDGVVLVIHDEDLKRMAGLNLKVWNTTAQELQQVDIGKKFSTKFAGQKIPTLEKVLKTCKGKIGVIIELKHYGHAQNLEQRVIDLVEKLQMQDQIQIMSLKPESIKKVRTIRPDWPVGILTAVAISDLTRVDADFLAVSSRIATQGFINLARRREKLVYVWTINDPIVMSTMISRGAKSIITDKPDLARKVLKQRQELTTVERLIVNLAILFGSPPPSSLDDA